jgi:hypothetical protein
MKTQFNDREFKEMIFNPAKVPDDVSVFKVYPELKKYKIFQKSPGETIDNNLVMLWIMCMYDKRTPYRLKYKDVLQRKIEAAHDVGFKTTDKGIFEDPVEDFMKCKNPIVNAKIVEFVRMHRSFKYSYLVAIENSYYTIILEVMSGVTKRTSELKGIQEDLENTLIEMLNEDNNPYIKGAVLRYMEDERLQLRPESVALKLLNNEHPVTPEEIQ